MIGSGEFISAVPASVARQLGDAVHLWRMPHARGIGRTPLLALLAAYLDTDAAALELRNDEHGKPHAYVRGEPCRGLQFNWSHSGEWALITMARNVVPGVDIEQARAGVKTLEIAQRFFAPEEMQAMAACADAERDALFFRLWCAKEAVLKALGRGLAFGLERVAFARQGEGWQPSRFDAEAGNPADWQVLMLSPAPGCDGALAWRGPPKAVRAFQIAAE